MPKKNKKKRKKHRKKRKSAHRQRTTVWWCCVPVTASQCSTHSDRYVASTARVEEEKLCNGQGTLPIATEQDHKIEKDVEEMQQIAEARVDTVGSFELEIEDITRDLDNGSNGDDLEFGFIPNKWDLELEDLPYRREIVSSRKSDGSKWVKMDMMTTHSSLNGNGPSWKDVLCKGMEKQKESHIMFENDTQMPPSYIARNITKPLDTPQVNHYQRQEVKDHYVDNGNSTPKFLPDVDKEEKRSMRVMMKTAENRIFRQIDAPEPNAQTADDEVMETVESEYENKELQTEVGLCIQSQDPGEVEHFQFISDDQVMESVDSEHENQQFESEIEVSTQSQDPGEVEHFPLTSADQVMDVVGGEHEYKECETEISLNIQSGNAESFQLISDDQDRDRANPTYEPAKQYADSLMELDDGSVFEFDEGMELFSPMSPSSYESFTGGRVLLSASDLFPTFPCEDEIAAYTDARSMDDLLGVEFIEPTLTKSTRTITEEVIIQYGCENDDPRPKTPSFPSSPVDFNNIPTEEAAVISEQQENGCLLDEKTILKQKDKVFNEKSSLPLPENSKTASHTIYFEQPDTSDLKIQMLYTLEDSKTDVIPEPKAKEELAKTFQVMHEQFDPKRTDTSIRTDEGRSDSNTGQDNSLSRLSNSPSSRSGSPHTRSESPTRRSGSPACQFVSTAKRSDAQARRSDIQKNKSLAIQRHMVDLEPADINEEVENIQGKNRPHSMNQNMGSFIKTTKLPETGNGKDSVPLFTKWSNDAVSEVPNNVVLEAADHKHYKMPSDEDKTAKKNETNLSKFASAQTLEGFADKKVSEQCLNKEDQLVVGSMPLISSPTINYGKRFRFNVSSVKGERKAEDFDLELDFSINNKNKSKLKDKNVVQSDVSSAVLQKGLDERKEQKKGATIGEDVFKRSWGKSPRRNNKDLGHTEAEDKTFSFSNKLDVEEDKETSLISKEDEPEMDKMKLFIKKEILASEKVKSVTSLLSANIERSATGAMDAIPTCKVSANQNARTDCKTKIQPVLCSLSSEFALNTADNEPTSRLSPQYTEVVFIPTTQDERPAMHVYPSNLAANKSGNSGGEFQTLSNNLVAKSRNVQELRRFSRRRGREKKVPIMELENYQLVYSCWDNVFDSGVLHLQTLMKGGDFGRTCKGMYNEDHVVINFYRNGFPALGADVLLALCSPFTANVLAYLRSNDGICMIYPYFEFGTLHNLMKQDDKRLFLKEPQAEFVLGCLLHATEHLHKMGVIHGNITPKAVLLNDMMYPVIGDFTFAYSSDSHVVPRLNDFDPNYAAPERLGGLPLGTSVDIFSVGCIAYQMVSGEPPYKGATTLETLGHLLDLSFRPDFPNFFCERTRAVTDSCIRRPLVERLDIGRDVRTAFVNSPEIVNLTLQVHPSPLIPAVSRLYEDNQGTVSKYLFRASMLHTI